MEPKTGKSFEQPSIPPEYGNFSPEIPANSPDVERRPEVGSGERESRADGTTALPPPPITLPAPVTTPTAQPATPATDDNPSVAADEDLIEKEWVDKAKKIISSTRDDPYAREREINKLQIDYLKKRYAKTLGQSE